MHDPKCAIHMTPDDAQTFLTENFAPWVLALHPSVTQIDAHKSVLRIPVTDALNRTGRPIYSYFCPRSCGGSLDTRGNFSAYAASSKRRCIWG